MQEQPFECSDSLRRRLVTYFAVHYGVELSNVEVNDSLKSLGELYAILLRDGAGDQPPRHTEPRGDFGVAQRHSLARDKSP